MRILLVDADSVNGFPNLALMKLSAHHKTNGDEVDIIKGMPTAPPLTKYDRAYISCIFFQNVDRVREYASMLDCPVEVGGSGISLDTTLPDEIEHIMPDYDLYDIDFSMGFTSRGCTRKCPWCVVPEKEGSLRDNASLHEFLHPDHTRVILLDNNFLASPRWRNNLSDIIESDMKVNFSQGLDIRYVDEEKASLLVDTKSYDWHFKRKKFVFALDLPSPDLKRRVEHGVQLLRDAGIKLDTNNCMFYVLVGFNTTIEEDLERIHFLLDLNVGPFIMRHNSEIGPNRILLHLARWVNRRLFRITPFEKYDWSDSQEAYKRTFGTEKTEQETFISELTNRRTEKDD